VVIGQLEHCLVGVFIQQTFEQVVRLLRLSLLVNDQQPVHKLNGLLQDFWTVHLLLGGHFFCG